MARASREAETQRWAAVCSAARWTSAEGRWVVAQWRDSGLSVQGFAEKHGLDPQRVYFWRKRSSPKPRGERGARPALIEVEIAPSASSESSCRVDIQLNSGRRLSVAESIDVDVLERVVSVLER